MVQNVITSIIAFASTNVDDIFILTLFFASGRYSSDSIVAGQFLGIAFLVGVSLLLSFIGKLIDPRIVGLLGFFPIYLSVRQIIGFFKNDGYEQEESLRIREASGVASIFSIAMVTIANGGDNIGVYVPLFATLSDVEKIQLCVIFVVMVFIWCYAAKYLSTHPMLSGSLNKYAHIIMPMVLFILGIFILVESGTHTLVM